VTSSTSTRSARRIWISESGATDSADAAIARDRGFLQGHAALEPVDASLDQTAVDVEHHEQRRFAGLVRGFSLTRLGLKRRYDLRLPRLQRLARLLDPETRAADVGGDLDA